MRIACTVHLAMIRHGHGEDVYVAGSPDDLLKQIAGYVEENTHEIRDATRAKVEGLLAAGAQQEAIDTYFAWWQDAPSLGEGESLGIETRIVEFPD